MAYTRAEANQIDAWQTLGNEGWNWSTLYPYYLKSETFQIPDAEQMATDQYVFWEQVFRWSFYHNSVRQRPKKKISLGYNYDSRREIR